MRIGFIERLARQAMDRKGWSRGQALTRHAITWALFAGICLGVWAFAPIKEMTFTRRGTEVPLSF
ncbi:MAG: hypothetical protein AAGA70_10590 [Pseudomonadota bacterium]